MLGVGDGNEIYWEASGNPEGIPVLHVHGGPGSGMGAGYRRRVDPTTHRIIGFEQRGCGRSRPLATDPSADLSANTTPALIADMEALREHLGIDAWLVCGVSWGTTLSLAYAQAHPDRVTGLVLMAVTTTSTAEVEWITESVGRIFPREWEKFSMAVPRRDGERIVDAYARATADPVTRPDAARSWCEWEDAHVSLLGGAHDARYDDPAFREVFATLVTHYWSNSGFGGDDILGRMPRIAQVPGVLIHGRRDVSGPLVTAWNLHKEWPASRLLVFDEGHGGPEMVDAMLDAITELTGS